MKHQTLMDLIHSQKTIHLTDEIMQAAERSAAVHRNTVIREQLRSITQYIHTFWKTIRKRSKKGNEQNSASTNVSDENTLSLNCILVFDCNDIVIKDHLTSNKSILQKETIMKAIAIERYLPIEDPHSFIEADLPTPVATGRDILVEIKAVAMNPVDTKVRAPKEGLENPPRVIGYDASGVVTAVGDEVTLFKVGDEVYYAGDITRSGSNAEYQLVDERIVGNKPKSLNFAEAAALPLTTITAYEAMFDRLGIDINGDNTGQTLLIIGAGGGVGSIGIQLAKQAGLTVIATSSRKETTHWVKALGADHVINHREDMVEQVRNTETGLGIQFVDYIAIFNDMGHWDTAVELIRPQGGIVSIEDADAPTPMANMKTKAASFHWEFMFTRAMFKTPDMIEQHHLLNYVSEQVDKGNIKTTVSKVLSPINVANIRHAHSIMEAGTAKGKIVLEGF